MLELDDRWILLVCRRILLGCSEILFLILPQENLSSSDWLIATG